ncbi:MAG: hypothetical protein ACQERD_00260 [Campylobacterota bacterium]
MDNLDKIAHHIRSISKDMYSVKSTIMIKEKEKKDLMKKEKKRRESLKKAQSKFNNISTNLKADEYNEFLKIVKDSGMTKSAYLKKLILDDIDKKKVKIK